MTCHTGACPARPGENCGPYGRLCCQCRNRVAAIILRLIGQIPLVLRKTE